MKKDCEVAIKTSKQANGGRKLIGSGKNGDDNSGKTIEENPDYC